MLVKKYRSKIVSVNNPIQGIYNLEFESLVGNFKYHPGQFLHLAMDSNYDGSGQWPESRCFSMQSNPDESKIRISYAVKGNYTRQMEKNLKVGSEIWLKLPYGNLFTQNHNKVNTVFIAGGTGITPFLSLFTHHSFRNFVNPHIYLGFRSKSYNIYNDDLTRLDSSFIKIYYEDSDGLIDIDRIFSIYNNSTYFISGPPLMISFFKKSLIDKGLNPANILTDNWE
jgi:ferredoxin-NADP reductase